MGLIDGLDEVGVIPWIPAAKVRHSMVEVGCRWMSGLSVVREGHKSKMRGGWCELVKVRNSTTRI